MRHHAYILPLLLIAVASPLFTQERNPQTAVIWTDPAAIRSKNLYWGPGGEEGQPKPPVEFEKEDMHGTSPKFEVRDSDGEKWTAKMGLEPRPETAVARLIWAIGYVTNENYYYPELAVKNLPNPLRRGQNFVRPGGTVLNVRLQRHPHGYKKVANWGWRKNPFFGTREFNGLRVMMALIANWDLKDENNAVLQKEDDPSITLYEVSDVGTALGTPGKSYTDPRSKGNLVVYRRTRLISHAHTDYIDLNFPRRPPLTELFEFEWGFFFHQLKMRWFGRHIPRSDGKWVGSLLAQLSPDQIRDAFRAAGYAPLEIEAYTLAVISRIQELNSL